MGEVRQAAAGRLIAFEGVDGAGKSTVLARVADALRAKGRKVCIPRLGKEHSSRPTRRIRELTRDKRNLELTPTAELLLYCAREAQVLHEQVVPALRRGETVLIDRSLLTPLVLGRARGLGAAECERATAVAASGVVPDLTLVFDVHPRTSRIRKRIERVRTHTLGQGGRKGLSGSAFKERVRALYNEIASERGYPVFHVERATPDELSARVLTVVEQGAVAKVGETEDDRCPQWRVPADWSLQDALSRLPEPVALFLGNGLIAARALRAAALEREPALVAWSLDPEDPCRERLAVREPEYALRALNRKPLEGESDLRLRLLAAAPAAALSALKHLRDEQSDTLRARYADSYPDAVLASLTAREDAFAEALRSRCWKAASAQARVTSLGFCQSDVAWKRRQELLEKDPVLAIESVRGLCDRRADRILERYADHAPKAVLSALGGRRDPAAYALRDALFCTGREVIDSVRGLGDAAAWGLRERAVARWPSTVAHSLLGLGDQPRVRALAARCEALADGDVHVLRRLQGLAERPRWPAWARQRVSLGEQNGDE